MGSNVSVSDGTTTEFVSPDASASAELPPSGEAYKAAMELVRGKKFSEAREAFDAFTQNYPGDPLAVNAFYWAGEVSLVEGKTDLAQARFRTIVEKYPEHTKAADATYKLGVALEKSGKPEEARGYLQTVIDKYTGTNDSTVALAKSYMKKLPAKAQATAE
ncbi:MAG: tol-pal system protein YbgF [Thalassolituus sp.]